MSSDRPFRLPPKGSFPGFKRGVALYTTLTDTLWEQSNIWNDIWSKLKAGSFKMEDGYQAFTESVETSSEAVEDMVDAIVTGSIADRRRTSLAAAFQSHIAEPSDHAPAPRSKSPGNTAAKKKSKKAASRRKK